MRHLALLSISIIAAVVFAQTTQGALVLTGGGLELAEQGGAFAAGNLAEGATAFALDELSDYDHLTVELNDLTYGNANSWIGGGSTGTVGPIAGISIGASPTTVASFAFGRSNVTSGDACGGGVCTARWAGLYTLQYTQVASPDASTADGDWTTVGTLEYGSAVAGWNGFDKPWERHRYNFDPVAATGIRLIVPTSGLSGGTAIDEIELYAAAGEVLVDPPPPPIVFSPEPGFSISWDGNEGDFFDPAGPAEQVGAPDNLALAANGATAFASSAHPAAAHAAAHAIDGIYGNTNSWLGDLVEPSPFVGIDFAGTDPVAIARIAFGRDNGNNNPPGNDPGPGGQLVDRWQGLYTLQYTLTQDPDVATADTGDASTGWATVGTMNLARQGTGDEPFQEPWLRHEFDVSADGGPVMATGIRIIAPQPNAIDEIEVFPIPEPSTVVLLIVGGLCLALCRRRRAV